DAIKLAPELLSRVEAAAGPSCDNLSLIVMVWADSHRPAIPAPRREDPAPAADSPSPAWTDEEIDRAIETIRARMNAKEYMP
ncbi:MAG: hypothetical protein Q7U85_05185, partial [Rhodocyclaceae bacterium]|nr:hypothetical protein [Rhodocyclaceae bacterium]